MPLRFSGSLGVLFWLIHAVDSFHRGEPDNLLWTCNLAALLVGIGQLRRSAVLNAVGVFWLFWGVPVWIVGLLGGEEFICSAVFTHVGGLILGLFGLRALGLPRGIWWKAWAAGFALQHVCRWITPERENVNLAFAVYSGWQRWFPTYALYWAFLVAACGTILFAMERLLLLVTDKPRA